MSVPLVSVYWISGYRGEPFLELVRDFRARTSYENLEFFVVDWSVGPAGVETRRAITESGLFDRVILKDEPACVYGNRNTGVLEATGDYVLGLEDDVRLKASLGPTWLADLLEVMEERQLDSMDLWRPDPAVPGTLACLSRRDALLKVVPAPCYPTEFSTLSESMHRGGRAWRPMVEAAGIRCDGVSYVETSMAMPSRNLFRQREKKLVSWESVDLLIEVGAYSVRRTDVDWVDFAQYVELGAARQMDFRLHSVRTPRALLLWIEGRARALRAFLGEHKRRLIG